MNLIQALILGFVQGITEFLPISSSGHLLLFPKLLGWQYQGLVFDVMVHMGSLTAVIIYFRKRVWSVLKSLRRKKASGLNTETMQKRSIFWATILSIVPAGVVGLWFGDYIEVNTRSMQVVALSLIFWGIVLGVAEIYGRYVKEKKTIEKVNWKNALFIGCAQAIALIPGTSRSGVTITAGLFAKFSKKDAAEFSFLMSIPIIALAGMLKILELYTVGSGSLGLVVSIVGFLSAMLSSFLAITLLMKLVVRFSFMPFVAYRIALGVVILYLF